MTPLPISPRKRRMVFVALIVAGVAGAATFGFRAFQMNKMYFITPSDLLADANTTGKSYRLGGMVKQGSVQRTSGSLEVKFVVTDLKHDLPVSYTGVLPDLFREGQGVITRGKFVDGTLMAEEVLAKHDENYMPPDVADKLKENHGGRLPVNGPVDGPVNSAPANPASAQ
jgi:cytochrome c-type biogenesis protein CcmE